MPRHLLTGNYWLFNAHSALINNWLLCSSTWKLTNKELSYAIVHGLRNNDEFSRIQGDDEPDFPADPGAEGEIDGRDPAIGPE